MKVVIVNYRYFVSSGPERYLFNVKEHLERESHEVIPFSIRYSQNERSEYDRYFVSPIGSEDEVFFSDHSWGIKTAFKSMSRLVYSGEVERAMRALIEEARPEVVFVLYFLRKMSPAVLVAAKKAGLPLVVRISDFGLFCPEHHCLRDGAPCTLCLKGDLTHSIRNRCVKGSLALSAADAAATYFHRLRGYFDLVDRWVVTNDFMAEMMIASGIDPQKIVCIPTFTDLDHFKPAAGQVEGEEPYLACVGRLDEPKGVHVLIEALARLKAQGEAPVLKIAGAGHGGAYEARLRHQTTALGLEDRVRFLGRLDRDEIAKLIAGARYCVAPSLWYENLPNSVIESLASGTPVIAADIGSLPMTVTHQVDGLLFKAGSPEALAEVIKVGLGEGVRERLSVAARRTAEQRHAPKAHISKLLQLFSGLIEART